VLVQLYYKGGVSEEVLKAEQERIEIEHGKARRWADTAEREVEDVMAALDNVLILLDDNHVIYEAQPKPRPAARQPGRVPGAHRL
jgi:hypothetical protein